MRGCMDTWLVSWIQGKERKIANIYCQHKFTSNAITHFAWKYYGSTVPCEQC